MPPLEPLAAPRAFAPAPVLAPLASWHAPAAREEPSPSQGLSDASQSHPWPELPEASFPEPADTVALFHQWERLRRLDAEQRGD